MPLGDAESPGDTVVLLTRRWIDGVNKKVSRGGGRYEIVVRGERFASEFEGVDLKAEGGRTVLVGEIVDQSHLHGLFDRLSDFGLELLNVEVLCEEKG